MIFFFMLQIMGLLRCFTAYEKDDGVKLLIMKVSDTTVFLLSFDIWCGLTWTLDFYVLFLDHVRWGHPFDSLGAIY